MDAARAGKAPAPAAVKHLADAWIEWIKIEGSAPIDKVLGLAGRRGNCAPAGKERQIAVRDYVYCDRMTTLVRAGFTVEEAAYAVAEKEKRFFSVPSRWNLKPLSAKSAQAVFIRDVGASRAKKTGALLNDAELSDLLKRYPAYTIPAGIKGKGKGK